MASNARLDLRLDASIKMKAEKASALLGMSSLTEYVVKLMDEHATEVIAHHQRIQLEDDIFDQFMQACAQAKKPNQKLKDALQFANEQGFV